MVSFLFFIHTGFHCGCSHQTHGNNPPHFRSCPSPESKLVHRGGAWKLNCLPLSSLGTTSFTGLVFTVRASGSDNSTLCVSSRILVPGFNREEAGTGQTCSLVPVRDVSVFCFWLFMSQQSVFHTHTHDMVNTRVPNHACLSPCHVRVLL